MHPVRKQRLITTLFILIASSAAIGLVLFSLGENLNSFYPPAKIAAGEVPKNKTIRAGGCVVPGTVKETGKNLEVLFEIADHTARVSVRFDGILPDLFDEGEAAVVIGMLGDDNIIEASEVLAKHDEAYMPPEVIDTLEQGAKEKDPDAEFSLTCKGLNL